MRVLCINGVKEGTMSLEGIPAPKVSEIYEGEVYTVSGEENENGRHAYTLVERLPFYYYASKRFIPLSDIDETELVNEEFLTKKA